MIFSKNFNSRMGSVKGIYLENVHRQSCTKPAEIMYKSMLLDTFLAQEWQNSAVHPHKITRKCTILTRKGLIIHDETLFRNQVRRFRPA